LQQVIADANHLFAAGMAGGVGGCPERAALWLRLVGDWRKALTQHEQRVSCEKANSRLTATPRHDDFLSVSRNSMVEIRVLAPCNENEMSLQSN
jgi:hypothetical protein